MKICNSILEIDLSPPTSKCPISILRLICIPQIFFILCGHANIRICEGLQQFPHSINVLSHNRPKQTERNNILLNRCFELHSNSDSAYPLPTDIHSVHQLYFFVDSENQMKWNRFLLIFRYERKACIANCHSNDNSRN